jgi:hypothetical protein
VRRGDRVANGAGLGKFDLFLLSASSTLLLHASSLMDITTPEASRICLIMLIDLGRVLIDIAIVMDFRKH